MHRDPKLVIANVEICPLGQLGRRYVGDRRTRTFNRILHVAVFRPRTKLPGQPVEHLFGLGPHAVAIAGTAMAANNQTLVSVIFRHPINCCRRFPNKKEVAEKQNAGSL